MKFELGTKVDGLIYGLTFIKIKLNFFVILKLHFVQTQIQRGIYKKTIKVTKLV